MSKKEIVIVDPQEFGLQEEQAEEVQSVFLPVIEERRNLEPSYSAIIQAEQTQEISKKAKELRLKLVKVRTATDKIHKTAKAFYLAGGRFVDAWKNKNNAVIEEMEANLKEKEEYYERIEAQKKAELKAKREQECSQYTDISFVDLGGMPEEIYQNYFVGIKKAYDEKIEAEKKAEQERLKKEAEEKAEQERIREENEKLRKEREEREKELEKERKEREIERQRIEKENNDKLRKEREEKEKAETELKRKEQEESQKKADEERKQRELENAGDKVKIQNLLDQIKTLKLPELKNKLKEQEIKEILNNAFSKISNI